jgi:hypothetical protein
VAQPAGAIFAPAYYPTYRKNRDSRLGRKIWAEATAEPFSSLLGDVSVVSEKVFLQISRF